MYQFRYHNPWMWDKRKSFTFKTWHTSGNSASFSPTSMGGSATSGLSSFRLRDELRRGVSVAIGIPKTYDLRFYHSLQYEAINLTQENSKNKFYEQYSYKFTISHDTRDIFLNPRQGHYYTFSTEKAAAKDSIDTHSYY